MNTTRFCLALFALVCAADGTASPNGPIVDLRREGGAFRLRASFEAQAPGAVAWSVLTDYEGMTRFVSSLRKSSVTSRTPEQTVIEQEGVARLLIFSRRISLLLKVIETPPKLIEFSDIKGKEFEEYEGSWLISESSGTCLVSYELFAEMRSSLVPRNMARRVLEQSVKSQLQQVQTEIKRRAAAPAPE